TDIERFFCRARDQTKSAPPVAVGALDAVAPLAGRPKQPVERAVAVLDAGRRIPQEHDGPERGEGALVLPSSDARMRVADQVEGTAVLAPIVEHTVGAGNRV